MQEDAGGCRSMRITGAMAVASFAAMHCSARRFVAAMVALLSVLPGSDAPSIRSFCWRKLWLGLLLEKAVTVVGLAFTMLRPDVSWASVRYWKRGGRIQRVQHLG